MDELKNQLADLSEKINSAALKLELEAKQRALTEIDKKISDPEFWADSVKAQEVSKRRSKLAKQIEPWLQLSSLVGESLELAELDDASLNDDLKKATQQAQAEYDRLEFDLMFDGLHDDYEAIVSIQSGAGGTDAQDWAQMLQRMYIRWTEIHDMSIELIDESPGDEAGIKSATMSIAGPYAYGKLRGEHGVHRLVRLSPFNSGQTRETSFAMVEVLPQIDEPDEAVIDDKDLRIDVYRASGHGGQSVNTTDSAVRVTHLPTNIVVSIQNEKSQIQNRETALKILRSKLIQLQQEQHKEKLSELRGPSKEVAWGNQIRSYVLHPYTMVKDARSKYETTDTKGFLDGQLDEAITAYLKL